MFKKLIALIVLVFILGWISHTFFTQLALVKAVPEPTAIMPQPLPQPAASSLAEQPVEPAIAARDPATYGREVASPADRLKMGNVHVTNDRVVIDGIPGRQFETAIFTSTHSMDPVLDETSQAIQIIPLTAAEIKVGDVISYNAGQYGVIIHRVIATGRDNDGWYAIVKGDNNSGPDPLKVRFSMIRRVLVGVLY